MKQSDNLTRLQHMLAYSEQAIAITRNKARIDLEEDETISLAVTRLLEIIGEASSHIEEQVKTKYPEIDWKEIYGIRNRLAHGYFDVDLDIIWQIIKEDLPNLVIALKQAIASEQDCATPPPTAAG